MNYATTLEVVRLAEQFHVRFEQARETRHFDGIAKLRQRSAEALPAEAEWLFRQLTSLQCLNARPDLAEHFLDGNLG